MENIPVWFILAPIIMIPVFALFETGVLWCVMRLMREEGRLKYLFLASLISTLLAKIPYVGWFISFAALVYLLFRWTSVSLLKSFFINISPFS